jgi:hypothetical protein
VKLLNILISVTTPNTKASISDDAVSIPKKQDSATAKSIKAI